MIPNFWDDTPDTPSPALKGSEKTQYLIVGGGIAGLSTAYFLLEAGLKDIILIERETMGSGSTGHSAGMLVCEPEIGSWNAIFDRFGLQKTRAYWEAQDKAFQIVLDLLETQKIKGWYKKDPLLMVGTDEAAVNYYKRETLTRKALGAPSEIIQGKPLKDALNTTEYIIGQRVGFGISVNPLAFVRSFRDYLKNRGVRIYEHTPLLSYDEKKAFTPQGSIDFEKIILARGPRESKKLVNRNFCTILMTRKLLSEELAMMGLSDRDQFIENEKRSYHYGRVTQDNRLLLGYGDVQVKGGAYEHPLHQPHAQSIERFLKRAFPEVNLSIEAGWTAEYTLPALGDVPVYFQGNTVFVNGGGTQIVSIAFADYVVQKLLGKKHSLDILFENE